MKNKIIMASGNIGKIKEAQEILNEYNVVSMKTEGIDIDVEENGVTFEENAIIKAEAIAKQIAGNNLCLADDSGIEIEYLNGFPGVHTKRWLDGTDRERNLAIIEKLKGEDRDNRKIRFVTAMAVSNGKKTISAVESIEGFVATEPRGKNGFGFDEIFELEDGRTLAELTEDEKNEISARKLALMDIEKKLTFYVK